MFEEFDEEQLNQDSGLTASSIKLEENSDGQFAMNADDKTALDKIAEQKPNGLTLPPPAATPAVPDYLTTFIPAPPETAPVREEKDWAKIWKETFGEEPAADAVVNRDSFENRVLYQDAYNNFMTQTQGIAGLQAVVAGQLTDLELIQQAVKSELHKNGIRSKGVYDQEMSEFVDADGNLTDVGQQRVTQEKEQAKRQLSQFESAAKQHANTAVDNLSGFYSILDSTATTFSPFGLKLPEEMVADMKEDIRSGRLDTWLETSETPQEAADKMYLLSMVFDPARLAEFVRLADKRGQEYGANRRVGSQLA